MIKMTKHWLKKNLKKFGLDAILVLENWSAPNTKFHEPTRNKGLIRMLKKNGLTVHFIDELKTSSKCPNYEDDLEIFKMVINPRPYRRVDMPTVKCHRLLRCKNPKYSLNESKRKLWNRDLAAALNFRKVLISLRETSKRPEIFTRKQVPKPVSKKLEILPPKLSLWSFNAVQTLVLIIKEPMFTQELGKLFSIVILTKLNHI
ncbi:hypothetical protein RMCBS344292_12661 [Rhizopus microsporus]|nr:hypothetical protein RMCBS344292_12661 [Rhizopus microsporus]